jgi:hypothetical protein
MSSLILPEGGGQERPGHFSARLKHNNGGYPRCNSILNYALQFARDMDPALADKFVGMYVNRWTLDYGEEGRRAVRELLARGAAAGLLPGNVPVEFLSSTVSETPSRSA